MLRVIEAETGAKEKAGDTDITNPDHSDLSDPGARQGWLLNHSIPITKSRSLVMFF